MLLLMTSASTASRADSTARDFSADIVKRDERDMNRSVAPLKAAADATILDTTHLNADEALQAAIKIIGERNR